MPEMHETLLKKVPYIGKDLDNDGIIDTVPSQAVGPDGLPLDVVGLLTKINELHAALVVDKNAGVQVSGSFPELRGLSTGTKPTENIATWSTFVEMDTGTIYYWDGTDWQVF